MSTLTLMELSTPLPLSLSHLRASLTVLESLASLLQLQLLLPSKTTSRILSQSKFSVSIKWSNFILITFKDYTDEVSIEVNGAATAISDEDYYVIEGNSYQVTCNANGNPAPLVTIRKSDGTTISVRLS